MNNEFSFSDNVWARVIEIIQEAMLTGENVGDLLRQIRVQQDSLEPNMLVLTADYQKLVKESYEKMQKLAEEKLAARAKDVV